MLDDSELIGAVLALKLCLREVSVQCLHVCAQGLNKELVRDSCTPWVRLKCFRGVGSELGEFSERPRGKSRSDLCIFPHKAYGLLMWKAKLSIKKIFDEHRVIMAQCAIAWPHTAGRLSI